jgi:hypothetical protein
LLIIFFSFLHTTSFGAPVTIPSINIFSTVVKKWGKT